MVKLTERQAEIFEYIQDNMILVPPPVRDIASHFGMSVKGAYDHVRAIERKGYLTRKARGRRDCDIVYDKGGDVG